VLVTPSCTEPCLHAVGCCVIHEQLLVSNKAPSCIADKIIVHLFKQI
jgi:hypothetical protein